MKFTSLRLLNWKNFASVDLAVNKWTENRTHIWLAIADRMFFVGPNASGKSNFLDAFRFLRDLATTGGGLQWAVVDKRGGVSAIRCLAAKGSPDVEVAVEMQANDGTKWAYELAFNQDRQRRAQIRKERVIRNGTTVLDRPNDMDREDPERLTQTYLEQVNANREFRDIATFFASIRYMHIVPQIVREPDRSMRRSNDPFGSDFLEQVASSPEKTQSERLRRIRDALKIAIPQLDEIKLERDKCGTPHLRAKFQHWKPQGVWQSEEQFSDGTLRLIGLLWAVMEAGGPLLLEEPEMSLHSEIVRVLPQMLARVQRRPKRQIFLSTHSPDMLRDEGIRPYEVLLLIPGSRGTEVEKASLQKDTRAMLEGGLSLADVVIQKTRPERAEQLSMLGDE